LEAPDLGEVVLNAGNRQRLMFVAANFRKEVTSSALWLLSHGIQVQCFKATPFAMSESLFLNLEQIIPTPEAKELMIGMNAKEADEKNTEVELKSRHKTRLAFWEQALEAFKASNCELFNNISPSKDHWLSAGSGLRSCPLSLIFGHKETRVEFYMSRADRNENKFIFDALLKNKSEIEAAFGNELEWMRLDQKKASRIQFKTEIDGYNRDNWPEITAWLVENMSRLETTLKPYFAKISQQLKQSNL
jgi:hypothetical protein